MESINSSTVPSSFHSSTRSDITITWPVKRPSVAHCGAIISNSTRYARRFSFPRFYWPVKSYAPAVIYAWLKFNLIRSATPAQRALPTLRATLQRAIQTALAKATDEFLPEIANYTYIYIYKVNPNKFCCTDRNFILT